MASSTTRSANGVPHHQRARRSAPGPAPAAAAADRWSSKVLQAGLERLGETVDRSLCEHFALGRADLYDLIRVRGLHTFAEVLAAHGTGAGGCDICRPVVASILATTSPGHILDGEQASLQDTNDHFLANLQRDGTYSVVPRIPGGEITPEKLIVIGEVARDFDLYTKITGGQRIDLFGARSTSCRDLAAAGRRRLRVGPRLRQVAADGEVLRRQRRGAATACRTPRPWPSRSRCATAGCARPTRSSSAVSGCARECAEAQSKDVGVIATERGWNLYVGGNGGTRPRARRPVRRGPRRRHAGGRTIDRFLMYYVRTGDRLERTASWIERIGLDHLRRRRARRLRSAWARSSTRRWRDHVDAYECEWKATSRRPDRLRRASSPSSTPPDEPDPTVVFVRERGQIRPARPEERGRRRSWHGAVAMSALHDGRRHDPSGRLDPGWTPVCRWTTSVPDRGVRALVGRHGGRRLALQRSATGSTPSTTVDPFTAASRAVAGPAGR